MAIGIHKAYRRGVYRKMPVFCDNKSVFMSNIIKILLLAYQTRRMMLAGYVTEIGETRNIYEIMVRKFEDN
jgi:hypothetical protein